MANELTVTASILDNLVSQAIGVTALNVSQSANPPRSVRSRQVVTLSEAALALGVLTGATLGWCVIINLDAVNFMEVRVGTGSTKFCKIKAGEVACFRFGSGITAPYVIADTASVEIYSCVWEA